jgi:hypothetical protein
MNELPSAALQSKHACHTHGHRDEFLATANFGPPPFHLDYGCEIVGSILRYEVDAGELSVR